MGPEEQLIADEPAHQTFHVGDFVLYSHIYDGDTLQLVKYEHQLEGVPGMQVAIPAQALYDALQKLMAGQLEPDRHVVTTVTPSRNL